MGNTKVVDLGYLDATFMTLMNGGTFTISDAIADAWILDIRQRMVVGGLNDGVNWSLSRIALQNDSVTAWRRGWYLMVIKHLVAGVPSGDEWLIGFPRPANSTSNAFSSFAGGFGLSVTEFKLYFQFMSSEFYSDNQPPSILLHYNPNGLTSTYAIGAGVDFDPPTVNSRTNLPGFMPSGTMPKGILPFNFGWQDERRVALIFNPVAKIVGYTMSEFWSAPNSFVFSGRILDNKRVADTYNYGCIYLYSAQISSANAENAGHVRIETVDDLENKIGCFVRAHTLFLQGNQPYFDGTDYRFHRDKAIVATASYIKGELKPDLFPIQGAYQRHYLRMFTSEHGRALKINDRMCVPWADNTPPPFAGWPLNPQIPTIITP